MDERRIRVGDTLLVQAAPDSIDRLSQNDDFIVAHEPEEPDYRTEKIPHAAAIMAGVVGFVAVPWGSVGAALAAGTGIGAFEGLAAFSLPILVTALAGSSRWSRRASPQADRDLRRRRVGRDLPLGRHHPARDRPGADRRGGSPGNPRRPTGAYLPAIGVLWVFYLATGLITGSSPTTRASC